MSQLNEKKLMTIALILGALLQLSPAYAAVQNGWVLSGLSTVVHATVKLYRAGQQDEEHWGPRKKSRPALLGKAKTDKNGYFHIHYRQPHDPDAVLYLIADGKRLRRHADAEKKRHKKRKSLIRLATVLSPGFVSSDVVINERSTVATAYAMAQFINGKNISGKYPGLQNAAKMVQNLVDINTGEIALKLGTPPNGSQTSAIFEFNSLANMLASCVNEPSTCRKLFRLTRVPRGYRPGNTLQAMVNIAHYPWRRVYDLFTFAQNFELYAPALSPLSPPDAWTLAIRYADRNNRMSGPGNVAFDNEGNAWVNNNYVNFNGFNFKFACGSRILFAFSPTGDQLPGSPYGGWLRENGGLYGSGFGITIDPYGDIWASNFGFQGSNCVIPKPAQILLARSISQFNAYGQAISPSTVPGKPGSGGWARRTCKYPETTRNCLRSKR